MVVPVVGPAAAGGADAPASNNGPGVWESAAHAKGQVPQDAHEYFARKAARDATYQSLQFLPFCPHIPTCNVECKAPRWAWRLKPR